MLSANRPSRRALPWLRTIFSAAAVTALAAGCSPPQPPSTANAGSPPGAGPGATGHPRPPALTAHVTAEEDRPYGALIDACDAAVCSDDTTRVKVTFYAINKGGSHTRTIDFQIYALPDFTKQPLDAHVPSPTSAGGNKYQFTIDKHTTASGKFLAPGDYAIVIHVGVAGPPETNQYCAVTLHVKDCSAAERLEFKALHRFRQIAQDVPASVVPTPDDIVKQDETGAQIVVTMVAGATAEDTMDVAFYRASDGTQLNGSGSCAVPMGCTTAAYTIPPRNMPSQNMPLDDPQDVVAVARVRGTQNSVSTSFTVVPP